MELSPGSQLLGTVGVDAKQFSLRHRQDFKNRGWMRKKKQLTERHEGCQLLTEATGTAIYFLVKWIQATAQSILDFSGDANFDREKIL